MKLIKKAIIDRKGNVSYWGGEDFHSLHGTIKEKDMKSGIVKSHIGKEFIVFDADFIDQIRNIKRGPAVMVPKDIGYILAYCGVDERSKIVEAGSGCGILTAFLGRISKNVFSYEVNEDFFKLAKDNLEFLNVKARLKNKDIYENIEEDDLNLIILDLPEPWRVLESAEKKLKSGGFFVAYLPTITQVSELINDSKKRSFYFDKAIELIEREWHVEGLKVRPKSSMIGHTGFLVFLRKI